MDLDNRRLVFGTRGLTGTLYSLTHGVFRYDPATMHYTTIARSTLDFELVYGLVANQDGDWYANALGKDQNLFRKYAVYRIGNGGGWTTVLTTMQLGVDQGFTFPIGRDVDTGDLLIPSFLSPYPVYALSHQGRISTWHASLLGPTPTAGWAQEIATGDMLYAEGRAVYRAQKGGNPTSFQVVSLMHPQGSQAVVFDNQSAPTPQLIAYAYRQTDTDTTASLAFIDLKAPSVTRSVTFIQAANRAPIPYPAVHILHHRTRYIQPVKTGPAAWDLNFSFPAFPGRGYVVGANLTGVRPGFALADGRHVWLNYDPLLPLTVKNQIPWILDPGPLVLDAGGRAQGHLDARYFPLPLNIVIHIVVAVIDPMAPGGIAFLTEPYPFTL